jgi:hypothetical protein
MDRAGLAAVQARAMARRTEWGAAAACGLPHTGCRARVIRTLAHRILAKSSD